MEVNNSNSSQIRNNLIPNNEINNLLDSIVKIECFYHPIGIINNNSFNNIKSI